MRRIRTVDLIDQDRLRARIPRELFDVGEDPLSLVGLVDGREGVPRLLRSQHADERNRSRSLHGATGVSSRTVD